MEASDVSVFTTPDVPGRNFVAGCGEDLTYIFDLYEYDNCKDRDAAIGRYVGRATKDAKAIAAKLGWNCIVDFKPQIALNGNKYHMYCIVNVPFTMGTLYEN